jgi:transposase
LSKLTLGNAQAIREVIQASVKSNCEPHFLHRLHCMLLIAEGRRSCEVARWFGEHPRTIERWMHALDLYGVEGLREHHAGGRPAKLAGETAQRLALDLQLPPDASGYSKPEWSGTLLTQLLAVNYGIKLSARQCQRMLRRLARAAQIRAA